MKYQPSRLDTAAASAAALAGDLVPWRDAAAYVMVKPATLARWVDRGRLQFITVKDPTTGARRRYVSLAEVSQVEHETRHRGRSRE